MAAFFARKTTPSRSHLSIGQWLTSQLQGRGRSNYRNAFRVKISAFLKVEVMSNRASGR